MMPRLALVLTLSLTTCGTPATTPTGRYIGSATPRTPGPLCESSKATAQIRNSVVIFTPDDGTWILEGLANPDGTLTADHSRIGVNKQPYDTTFEAHWTPTTITGTYKTPRCTFTVDLKRI